MDMHTNVGVETIDVESYAKSGRTPPAGQQYRIRVDKTQIVVETSTLTGREILTRAGKTPPERYRLDQKLVGGRTEKIGLNQVVDLTTPGVERFMTLPLDQTEGATDLARADACRGSQW
jgi:hypothetical protein